MAEFITICPASDIPDGSREVFSIKNRWVAIFNVGDKYYAIEDLCTHDGNILTEDAAGNPVPLDGYEIACPRHGAKFDIRDGSITRGPALLPAPWFEVRIENGQIQIAI
ncbi:MAG: Rieske (2Fe-2S) protein [Aggregatilineales bacterium]